jgi:hypothetical protein
MVLDGSKIAREVTSVTMRSLVNRVSCFEDTQDATTSQSENLQVVALLPDTSCVDKLNDTAAASYFSYTYQSTIGNFPRQMYGGVVASIQHSTCTGRVNMYK